MGGPKPSKGVKTKGSVGGTGSDSKVLESIASTLSSLTLQLGSRVRTKGDFRREGKGPKPPHSKPTGSVAHQSGKGKEGVVQKVAPTNTTHAAKQGKKPKPKPRRL